MHKSFHDLLDKISLWIWSILSLGIPLVYTSYTRSVFEVNKLMLLRVSTILLCGVWLTKVLWDRYHDIRTPNTYYFGPFSWKKTGLDIPLILVSLSLVFSTLFSQNIRISIFGTYDRWEGILTYGNYILLFVLGIKLIQSRKHILSIIWCTIIASVLSGIYGIFQSLGMDFISWSLDPTLRVFACINNPVHFCAYMAMVGPLCLGYIIYLIKPNYTSIKEKHTAFLIKSALFLSATLLLYNQYLSYSRASWLGFLASITLFYLFCVGDIRTNAGKGVFIADFLNSSFMIALVYLILLFKVHLAGPLIASVGFGFLASTVIVMGLLLKKGSAQTGKPIAPQQLILSLILFVSLGLLFILPVVSSTILIIFMILISLMGITVSSLKLKGSYKHFFSRVTIILLFAQIQYIASSPIQFYTTLVLFLSVFLLSLRGNRLIYSEKKRWLFLYIVLIMAIIAGPKLTTLALENIQSERGDSFKILSNVDGKIGSYKRDALEGTARTSMWRSSFPWIKDYVIFGSGLDTIKFMYPHYRESEYGILEGGHNYTPDRLHNEYLNTLATKGVFGFVALYIAFIGGWGYLILKNLARFKNTRDSYLILACFSGGLIYLGQVLFNFGVVATLFLFYMMMALPLALINIHESEIKDQTSA